MHIVYSAFRHQSGQGPTTHCNSAQPTKPSRRQQLRYQGYKAACHKYRHEIAAIQQYLPDWQPRFR